jgi:HD-GYP domain-containing protein (c-di-GMP phosphodiesterase class II)
VELICRWVWCDGCQFRITFLTISVNGKMVLKRIQADDLKIGMYVIMPTSWDAHPFLKNKFCLTSKTQIDKIRGAGLYEVIVETDRSTPEGLQGIAAAERLYDTRVEPGEAYPTRGARSKAPRPQGAPVEKAGGMAPLPPSSPERAKKQKEPKEARPTVVTDKLREAIQDRKLPPQEKSRIVRDNTLTMMDDLLNRPTAKNIQAARGAIAEIVELILRDDATATYLTKITSHDFYTYTHSVNVGFLGVSMAKSLFRHSDAHNMRELGIGFFLHDLGKVQIDPAIIKKPGRLTEEEMDSMRQHPMIGYKILYETEQLTDECKTIVLQHHERYDGTGYPKSLHGKEIHIYGKICSIADVYEALTSDRPYRKRMAPFDALILMKDQMINHFQKDLYEKFVRMLS